ncbi:FGGY family carbohydrate kinase [Salinisphaera orenii]|uniref:FGGY family carbohydrate kinase n=1 Tax=Salinisphaera orenii TaxID=856731 RepID=UPI000DBE8B46
MSDELVIGVDAGTSVIKAVAFDIEGKQVGCASRPNHYTTVAGGGVEQDANQTWSETAATLIKLGERVDRLADRTVAISVTGQGDGTWLIDAGGEPVMPSWLWLDSRTVDTVTDWRAHGVADAYWRLAGTGLNPANQCAHLKWLACHRPELLERGETVFHCKDWLYFKLTGERVTDLTEMLLTFGDIRTGDYSDELLEVTGLTDYRRLLPPVVDGRHHHAPLTAEAARAAGLKAGVPVVLAPIDIQCSGLGGGVYAGQASVGCSTLGSTGAHMRVMPSLADAGLDGQPTDPAGYIEPFAQRGSWLKIVSNMAASLNIDWFISALHGFAELIDGNRAHQHPEQLLAMLDEHVMAAEPAQLVYHPFIYATGERGPFVDPSARAQFLGLHEDVSIIDMLRAIYEAIAFAARDCYEAMGPLPDEIRLTGGFARSATCRHILAAICDRPVRCIEREETGAAGAAIVAGLSLGHYADLDRASADWVTPYLGSTQTPQADLAARYAPMFDAYRSGYRNMRPFWQELRSAQRQVAV